jgi:hypothetical protein
VIPSDPLDRTVAVLVLLFWAALVVVGLVCAPETGR